MSEPVRREGSGKKEVREQEVEAYDTEGLINGGRKVGRKGSLPSHIHEGSVELHRVDVRWIEHHECRNVHLWLFFFSEAATKPI